MAATLSTVLTIARTYLNDDNATQFPDPVLIPKVQEAHRELQEQLWQVGSPVVRAQSVPLQITTGTRILGPSTTPPLPVDLLCPTALFEAAGSAGPYSPMTEAFYIPLGYAAVAALNWWCWQQEQILLGGSTGTVYVVIQYRRSIPIPAMANDPIGILFGESYLGARSAALAAGTLQNDGLFTGLTAIAKENLANVLSSNRGQQKPQLRP